MAARTVYKLFTKTCPYSLNSSPIVDKSCRKSASHTPKRHKHTRETFFQERKLSRSFQYYKEKQDEDVEREETSSSYPTDLSRDVAKKFEERPKEEKSDETGNPIYELAEATRTEENYYDVLNYMRNLEMARMRRAFVHLQPSQLRPFGSNENIHYPSENRRRFKITYPVSHTKSQDAGKSKKFDEGQYKEFSSYADPKVYPGYEERKKATVTETAVEDLSKKKYSTSSLKPKKSGPRVLVSKRKSSSLFLKMRKKDAEIKKILKEDKVIKELHRRASNTKVQEKKKDKILSPQGVQYMMRKYNTQKEAPSKKEATNDVCSDFVKVKLSDLQEECRKEKRCKPKKISFGRLPKIPPPDCPCIEDIPLKEGKPILRLKKRFEVPDPGNVCPPPPCVAVPRADDGLKITPKTLRPIVTQPCPCEERTMTDFVIKRLPKKKVPEPPKICDCVTRDDCCPPRADGKIQVKRKVLPKLRVSDCPCVEDIPMKDKPLKRMKPVKVPEPKRECPVEVVCDVERADKDLKIEKKVLPKLNGECACVEAPKMKEGQPFKRLPRVEVKEPKRVRTAECIDPCRAALRADKNLKVKKKKLPVFHAQDCPCIEPELPGEDVKMKRLQPRFKYEDPKRIEGCKEECGPRADDGMVIKPKQLPQIELHECPCVEIELKDAPPLKRLPKKPVEEPPKVCITEEECTTPRSDENLKVQSKTLPVLPPGNCPCVELPQPEDVKPLRRLKKKPVIFKRECPVDEDDCPPRADENLKVKVKKLPKLEVGDCPCVEMLPPEDVAPLKRLPKVEVPEPAKVCPVVDDCAEPDRSDDNDWMYWKKVEVKPAECEPKKDQKRSFSTLSKRHYSTRSSIELLPSRSYNVVIDIKPSAPLILTQTPLSRRETEIKLVKPLDCVRFVIYKTNSLNFKQQESSSEVALVFNSFNRSISTCSTLCEYSERTKDDLKDHQTPQCECPKDDRYLQPKHPIIKEKEHFLEPYPSDDFIDDVSRKGRMYCRGSKEECGLEVYMEGKEEGQVCEREVIECEGEEDRVICEEETNERMRNLTGDKKLTLWERIVNYFKARPDCPSPEEFKKMRLREAAEKAAEKAGLCLYDPKEMLRKTQKELPKIITADSCQK